MRTSGLSPSTGSASEDEDEVEPNASAEIWSDDVVVALRLCLSFMQLCVVIVARFRGTRFSACAPVIFMLTTPSPTD